jgi:large subunit ribosomal protein L6
MMLRRFVMYEKTLHIPEDIKAESVGMRLRISGGKGKLERDFGGTFGIKIALEGNSLKVSSDSDERKQKAVVGAIVAHARNMIDGVTKGYTATLKVIYSHFPVTVKVEDKDRKVFINNFIGEKTPRVSKILGSDTKVEVKGADITVTGSDLECVGQTAANMETATKIRDHDRKVFQDGIYITSKPRGKN